jgi:glycolate oxidase iron-sulfur subunit
MTAMALENPPARIADLADQCVQCGLCLPVCPTYALDANEAESPRGRIAMAAALARGEVEPTAALREHLDHCLGCLHCERVCPAHVQYGELLLETRALLGPSPRRPRWLLALIKRPVVVRRLHRLARSISLPRWQGWLRRALPARSAWRAALALAPATPEPERREPLPDRRPQGPVARLALFPGCVASVEDAAAQQAAVTLFRAAGFEVAVLPAFCCGALDAHGGEAHAAEQAAQRVREAWDSGHAEQLITVTPGCLGTLRRALPTVRVADPYELLVAHAERLRFRPLAQRVALHLPCTQVNVARSESALLRLLHRVPDLEVMTVAAPPYCCGAAGSHMLEFPERAERLREATLRQIMPLAPQRLLSSNIGCRLHLAAGLITHGSALASQHPLVLLAQQLEPTPPAGAPSP